MAVERVEAEFTVSGLDAISASNGAQTTAYGANVTPGATFITGLLSDLQTQLNNNVQGYALSASALSAAIGFGTTWSSGWTYNEASGNAIAAFGGVDMTPVSSPTYGTPGPRGGIDKAVGFDSTNDAFSAGSILNVGAGDDLIWASVWRHNVVTGNHDLVGKGYAGGGGAPGWLVAMESASLGFYVSDAVDIVQARPALSLVAGTWYVAIGVLSRATNQLSSVIAPLSTGVPTVASPQGTTLVGALTNGSNLKVGDQGIYFAGNTNVSAFYIGAGVGVAGTLLANLGQACTNFANAVNSSFSVALGTDGRATISNSFWPSSVAFSSTLRGVLGFAYDFDYPASPTQMVSAAGAGAWAAGFQCNESSGAIASSWGSFSMPAVSTPTYSNPGPRGGGDKAVGFDSVSDAFGTSSIFTPGLTDFAILFVGKLTGTANVDFFGKGWGGGGSFVFVNEAANGLRMYVNDGVTTLSATAAGLPANQWFVAVGVIDRTANVLRVGYQSLLTGTQVLSSSVGISSIGTLNSASNFVHGAAGAYNETAATFQCGFFAVAQGNAAASFSASVGTVLSSFAAYMKGQTGTEMPAGLWMPHGPIAMDSDPKQAPTGDDKTSSISPTGRVYSLASSEYFRHRKVRFPMVEKQYVWSADAAFAGADWETFYLETQLGHHSWFDIGSRVRVYWNNAGVATELGNGNVDAWYMPQCVKLDELQLSVKAYTGLVSIELGDLFSDG